MRSHRFHSFGFDWDPAHAAITILFALVFLILLLLFLTILAQPAQGQSASPAAQTSVPPTARQAATMPQFAARLAHNQPNASYKNPQHPRARARLFSPDQGEIYDNGPVNGTTDGWDINFGFVVSDTFTIPSSSGTITGLNFYAWTFPGDVLQTAEISITSQPLNGGTSYFDGVVNFTQSACSANQYGYNVCFETSDAINVPNLGAGTYWANLQNAVVNDDDPIFWDENSGVGCGSPGCPSQASENSVGTIPSESFTILGETTTTTTYPQCVNQVQQENFEVIHEFTSSEQTPTPGLAFDRSNRVYGATATGGADGLGVAYQLAQFAQNWILNPLYSFLGGASGQNPLPGIIGPDGAVYGTADGDTDCGQQQNCGEVYRLTPGPTACPTTMCGWVETVIYRFQASPDGFAPNGNLVFDAEGNLYGTTSGGGAYGLGTVYQLTRSGGQWTERVIYSFTGQSDGEYPNSLLEGHDGYLYGASTASVFRLLPSGTNWMLQILVPGLSCTGMVDDGAGNLYCFDTRPCGYGGRDRTSIIFSVSYGNWATTDLEDTFDSPACMCAYHNCYDVFYGVSVDSAGRVYATEGSVSCDNGCFNVGGNVHQVPISQYGVLVGVGNDVFRDVEVAPNGNLYGTTGACDAYAGAVWQLSP